jgi:hypothetical protein
VQESSTAGLSLPSERIRIRTDLIVEKVGQGGSLLDARIAFAVMIEIDLDPSRTYPVTAALGAFPKNKTEIISILDLEVSDRAVLF